MKPHFSPFSIFCCNCCLYFSVIWSMWAILSVPRLLFPADWLFLSLPRGSECQRYNKHLSLTVDSEMGGWHWEPTECPPKLNWAGGPAVCPVFGDDQVALSQGCLLLPPSSPYCMARRVAWWHIAGQFGHGVMCLRWQFGSAPMCQQW